MKKLRGAGRPSMLPKRRLLYVEDNDDNWLVAELRLGRDFDLIRARTDKEACEVVSREADALCGVLMDIELIGSVLNGVELARVFRGKADAGGLPTYATDLPALSVPLLFVTAHDRAYAEEYLRDAGGDSVIPKPVDFKQLNMTLMRLQVGSLGKTATGSGDS